MAGTYEIEYCVYATGAVPFTSVGVLVNSVVHRPLMSAPSTGDTSEWCAKAIVGLRANDVLELGMQTPVEVVLAAGEGQLWLVATRLGD